MRATRAESRPLSSIVNEQLPPDSAAPDPAAAGRTDGARARARFETARQRLSAAFGALDAALSRHAERAVELADQLAEYSALQDDRSRLAIELDAAARRARALEAANIEASRRIERAAAAVRAVLASDSGERSAHAGAAGGDSSSGERSAHAAASDQAPPSPAVEP
jgi:Domain of unknown function (DUF4164)